MCPTDRRRCGFTLVELLIASALLLAASLTVIVFMSQGIRIFARLSGAAQEEAAAICMVKMTRDLRGMTAYSLIPFVGKPDFVEFAALEDVSDAGGFPDPSPVAVSWRFDAERARIVREVIRSQTFEQPAAARAETALDGVTGLAFEYEGDPQEIPRKITIRLEYGGRFGSRSVTREVGVPSAPVHSEIR